MIEVAVCGIMGRMGSTVAEALCSVEGLHLACGIDVMAASDTYAAPDGTSCPLYKQLGQALDEVKPDVLVDFTRPDAVAADIEAALARNVNCCIGTTGLSGSEIERLAAKIQGDTCLFIAPNFTTGAVLMMKFSEMAAKYFPDAEVIEFHHDGKADAPSGTAALTAERISAAKTMRSDAPGKETELEGHKGARGDFACDVPVHSVRTSGHVASQEVIFGSPGQTLTIRHDSIDRHSYMPGVMLACRKVPSRSGLIVGLEKLMDD